jgi:hypothetical protein
LPAALTLIYVGGVETSFSDLEALTLLAAADPDGPAALRLAWLKARAGGASRGHLLGLVRTCHERKFSIPEIHAYVAEQLAIAREGLERARKSGKVSEATLRELDELIRTGETTEQVRQDLASSPALVRALLAADELAEKAEKLPES